MLMLKGFFVWRFNLFKNLIKSLIRLTQLAVPYLEKTKGSIVNGYLIKKIISKKILFYS